MIARCGVYACHSLDLRERAVLAYAYARLTAEPNLLHRLNQRKLLDARSFERRRVYKRIDACHFPSVTHIVSLIVLVGHGRHDRAERADLQLCSPMAARVTLSDRELCALLCALELGRGELCAAHKRLLEHAEPKLKAALLRASVRTDPPAADRAERRRVSWRRLQQARAESKRAPARTR